tara:strand:- start:464 stop:916 length:453 start_codon:yes stop_codon:yes gene_type:complete
MPWSKEQKAEYMKKYRQSPTGLKSLRIGRWKQQGIFVEDFDKFYQTFLETTNCQICNKLLTEDKRTTHSTRCVDHDHNILDKPNVRAICCQTCNLNDKSTNTSGEPNISFSNVKQTWHFYKTIKGKIYSKQGFKTFEEAFAYKKVFLESL